jgi:hypothetical protein
MASSEETERGLNSGLLNLSRNVGLITGSSLMAYVFAVGSRTLGGENMADGAARGLRITFVTATAFILVALVVATRSARSESSFAGTKRVS